MKQRIFIYGDHTYYYDFVREERKSLKLTVNPDLSITLNCPIEAEDDYIDKFLKRKWLWLYKQLRFFERYKKTIHPREYVSGESYLYLGRQYKLIVNSSNEDKVNLFRGKLVLSTTKSTNNTKRNKKLLTDWYLSKAFTVFDDRLSYHHAKFEIPKPKLAIRHMERRWGSYLKGNKILLNPLLIHASKECIDYVIAHELCHHYHKNHTKEFYKLLEKYYPNWENVKEKLELKHG